jgi:hypothetical protein
LVLVPAVDTYVPAPQLLQDAQLVCPVVRLYVPAPQVVQLEAPEAE